MSGKYDSKQYRDEYRQVESDATWTAKRGLWKIFVTLAVIGVMGFGLTMLFRPFALVEKVTDPNAIISNYEDFQTIYNTCQKLDADLKTIRATPDSDAMFVQFSKGAMVAAKKQQMTRWVNEYNAKSKMITRNLWKSGTLPHQLNEEHFPNYNEGGSR